jgi:hypothetical protein
LSNPPMSVYASVGRSSTSIAFTRASYSAVRGRQTRQSIQRRTCWQLVEDQVRVLVHTDQVAWAELVVRDQADDRQEDGLVSAPSLDDDLVGVYSLAVWTS